MDVIIHEAVVVNLLAVLSFQVPHEIKIEAKVLFLVKDLLTMNASRDPMIDAGRTGLAGFAWHIETPPLL